MDAGERQALISLFNATGGDSWRLKKGWCTNAPLCEWFGVDTNDQGSVVKLRLGYNNLEGVIPAEIGELNNLQVLELYHNKLNGVIPAELGKLTNLQKLHLGANQLSGSIPKDIGLLINLEELILGINNLTGTIPKELGELKRLRHLYLNNNQLSGAIPKELGELKDLQRLILSNNQLSGAIPKELGELKGLRELQLSNNQLSAIGGVEEAQWLLSKLEGQHWGLLTLDKNPWIMPPEAVVENGMASIKTYYADVQMAIEAGAQVISRRLLKVVLVGSSSAGKTSLMESIISRSPNRTTGTPEEASTEGIDVRPHQLDNTSVEFYDCAGQVDYGGMHQVFLTQRSLFLLVWDISKCSGLSMSDLDEVIHDSIMRWVYALHLRAPGATVILVANKCDMAVNDATETARKVEKRVKSMLQEWKDRRGLIPNSGENFEYRPDKNSTDVNLLEGSSLISCDNYDGIPALIERVLEQCVSSIEVPPSWELALEFINALRCKRPPVRASLEYLQLSVAGEDNGDVWSGSFITKKELRRMWRGVVEKATDEMLRTNKSGITRLWQDFVRRVADGSSGTGNDAAVNSSDSALEGALRISEFAGQILLVEDGGGIFLDVAWLSELVTPILSHKLKDRHFPSAALSAMRDDLVEDKILRWEFARYLWSDVLSNFSLQPDERAAHALYSVLIKLGVILPLGTTMYATNEGSALRGLQRAHESSYDPPDMLVLMRLRETLRENQQRSLEDCTADVLRSECEVTLKWRFDAAGSPYGLIERLLASCHVIGVVERNLCWRYGALFHSRDMMKRFGRKRQLFTMVVRYDPIYGTSDGNSANMLTVRMIGRLEDIRVWAALRFVASAVILLSKEWPGAILEGSPICPSHPRVSTVVYLATPSEAHIGGPLIPEAARGDRRNGCYCHIEDGEVLGRVVKELGRVVDINKDPFKGLPANETSLCNDFYEMIIIWQPYARETAVGLWGLALVLFGGVTAGVVEEKNVLWQVCLTVMILSLVGAITASVVVYRDMRRRVAQSGMGQSAGQTGHDDGFGDIEAVPLMASSS